MSEKDAENLGAIIGCLVVIGALTGLALAAGLILLVWRLALG